MTGVPGRRALPVKAIVTALFFWTAGLMTSAADEAADKDDVTLFNIPALLVERDCYGCHSLTEPLIGPPYQAIANLHAGNKEAMVEVLARKVIYGGAGTWGVVPMVPNEHVSEDEARVMVRWILGRGGE